MEHTITHLYKDMNPQRSYMYSSAPSIIQNKEIEDYLVTQFPEYQCKRDASSEIRKHVNSIVEYVIMLALEEKTRSIKEKRYSITKDDIDDIIRRLSIKCSSSLSSQPSYGTATTIPRCLFLHDNQSNSFHPFLQQ